MFKRSSLSVSANVHRGTIAIGDKTVSAMIGYPPPQAHLARTPDRPSLTAANRCDNCHVLSAHLAPTIMDSRVKPSTIASCLSWWCRLRCVLDVTSTQVMAFRVTLHIMPDLQCNVIKISRVRSSSCNLVWHSFVHTQYASDPHE